MARFLFLLLTSFTAILAPAQDLSGTWEGRSTNAAYSIQLVVVRQGNDYVGYTYDHGSGFCKANFVGVFNTERRQLNGKGVSFIESSFSHSLMKLRLNYEKYDGEEYLRGISMPKTILGSLLFFSSPDQVLLKRVSRRADTTSFMRAFLEDQLDPQVEDTVTGDYPVIITDERAIDTGRTFPLPVLADEKIAVAKKIRSLDTISTIVTTEKNITITIFDNGQVDGDTVTIFHNNQVLLSNHFVSATPYKVSITLSASQPRHEIVLVANNLGSIPPNTAVLVVDAGEKRYRLNASADMKKNALLVFEYRE
jgi:hypothetical protein